MGKVYYDMGFLATAEVVECSATELVGQYVGQTGPKTQRLLEKGLGKVLFIDEAYRLAEGHFAKEAMDEIVDSITKPKFAQKLIIILAGYDADINRLMSINPGLTSRFPETMLFKGLDPGDSVRLLTELLQEQKRKLLQKKTDLDMASLECPCDTFFQDLLDRFKELSKLPNWANARDVQTIAKSIFGKTIKSATTSPGRLTVDEKTILTIIDAMIVERIHRSQIPVPNHQELPSTTVPPIQARVKTPTTASTKQPAQSVSSQTRRQDPPVPPHGTQTKPDDTSRDANVTDEEWERLQQDKAVAQAKENEYNQLLEQEAALQKSIAAAEEERKTDSTKETTPQKATMGPGTSDDEAKRRHEEERLRHELERRALEAEMEILRRKRQQEEERRQKEQEAQKKLRDMGVCCMGYRWIKQAGGYRGSAGGHYVSNEQLGVA